MPVNTNCPSCGKTLRVRDDLRGSRVRCPGCQTVFTANAADEESAPAPAAPKHQVTERPSSPPRRDPQLESREGDEEDLQDSYEEEEDDFEQPRRRRGGGSRRRALQMVSGPATGLMVTGIVGIVLGAINFLLALTVGGLEFALPNPNPRALARGPEERANSALVMGVQVGESGVIILCGSLVTYGGIQLRSLKSRGWAMAGSIIAMIPCVGCCILRLPIGIWSLVVLGKPEVSRAFG